MEMLSYLCSIPKTVVQITLLSQGLDYGIMIAYKCLKFIVLHARVSPSLAS